MTTVSKSVKTAITQPKLTIAPVARAVASRSGTKSGRETAASAPNTSAQRARAFGFEVGFYDPYVPAGVEKGLGGLRRHTSFEELLGASDGRLQLHNVPKATQK